MYEGYSNGQSQPLPGKPARIDVYTGRNLLPATYDLLVQPDFGIGPDDHFKRLLQKPPGV
jgi:hypothetical protein